MTAASLSERQKRRSIFAVTTIVFVDALGFALVLPILPVVASREFGASKLVIGLLVATFPFFQLLAAPFLGRMSDVSGRRPVLVLTMLGAAVGFAMMASAEWVTQQLQGCTSCSPALVAAAPTIGLIILFLARTVNGLTGGNQPVAQAYLADVTTHEERAQAMGGMTVAFALAYGIGPAIAGHLAVENRLMQPALLGCGIALLGTLLVYYFLPETRASRSIHELPVPLTAAERELTLEGDVFGDKPLWDINEIIAALKAQATGLLLKQWFLFILCFSIFAPMFALIAGETYGLDTRAIGLLLSSFAVLAILWQIFIMKPISRRLGDRRLALVGLAAFLACFVLLAVMREGSGNRNLATLTVMMLLFGLGFAAARPAITSSLSRAVPEDKVGGIMGVSQSLDSASTVMGPLLAGVVLQFASVNVLGLIAGVFASAAVLLNIREGRS
jgi:MFS transporter, DHA1 family, tetracycline resistance protein